MILGAVVITYNLPNMEDDLRLTPDLLAGIFLGNIAKWNDRRITSANPKLKLPDKDIIVVHRSDGSGTTYIFTDYLCNVSKEWAQKVGRGTSVNWPVGLGGKGNEGVTGQVKNMPGSIGYVELAYAVKNNLSCAYIQNKEGKFVKPTLRSITSAAAGVATDMAKDLRVSLVNPAGKDAYPISGFTWLLVYKDQKHKEKGQALVKFLWWAIHEGQKYAPELLYAPLPPQVIKLAEQRIKEINFQGKSLYNLLYPHAE